MRTYYGSTDNGSAVNPPRRLYWKQLCPGNNYALEMTMHWKRVCTTCNTMLALVMLLVQSTSLAGCDGNGNAVNNSQQQEQSTLLAALMRSSEVGFKLLDV